MLRDGHATMSGGPGGGSSKQTISASRASAPGSSFGRMSSASSCFARPSGTDASGTIHTARVRPSTTSDPSDLADELLDP
jgi:hypothetical protein